MNHDCTQLRFRGQATGLIVGAIALLVIIGIAGALIVIETRQNADDPVTTPRATKVETIEAVLAAARSYQSNREHTRASAVLEAAINEHSGQQDLWLALATSLVLQSRLDEAYRAYESAISLGPVEPQVQMEAGTVANTLGKVDRAEEHYSMGQSAAPSDPRFPLYLAMVQLKLGNESGAQANLIRAVTLEPELAEGWGTLAELSFKRNRLGIAKQHVVKALALQPRVLRWRVLEAKILARQNEPEHAATRLLALDPSEQRQPEVMRVLGLCYGMMNRPRDAAQMYAQSARALQNGELFYEAALWAERDGDMEAALSHARAASELGFADADAMLERLAAVDG